MGRNIERGEGHARGRLVGLDLLRGVAVVAMVVFHCGWDLSFLGLAAPGLAESFAWSVFGHAIAASFLVLAGFSLVLAHGQGVDSLKFLRRLGIVVAAALAVTIATYIALPEQFIYFGILHAIALGSLLAVPFLRAPLAVVVVAAGLVFVAPLYLRAEAFSAIWLVWLGLGLEAPPSTDYVPLLPWFGFILLGVLLGRTMPAERLQLSEPPAKPVKVMALAGRHSLAIYLLHQPILYGGLWLLAQAVAPPMAPEERAFLSSCTQECVANRGEALRCATICTCAIDGLKAGQLWSDAATGRLSEAGKARMGEIGRACALRPPTSP